MKNIILHIGRHKSGTSALQWFFASNSKYLADNNIIYPKIGLDNNIAHHSLALALRNNNQEQLTIYKSLLAQYPESKRLLFSSEAFQNIKDVSIVKDFFQGYHLTVVCYLREILDYHQSAYSQRVQAAGITDDFKQFCITHSVNYETFCSKWTNIADHIIIGIYDREQLHNNDIVQDFIKKLNLNKIKSSLNKFKRINPSIGGNLLFFKLHSNKLNLHSRDNYKIFNQLANSNKRFSSGFKIEDNLANFVRSSQSNSNKFLESMFGGLNIKNFNSKPGFPDQSHLATDYNLFIDQLGSKFKLLLDTQEYKNSGIESK